MNDEAIISFRDLGKSFGPVRALNEVNFEIRRGEFFSLLGPSGCGKTTLLRILAGFEFPSSGEVYIDGQAMSSIPPNRRPVNMVFQNYAIFPHLDVRGNIAFGMRKAGLGRGELDARIEEMLDLIKLPGFGSRAAHELSGGQRQRVALARALIKRPKVLLLDEPLGALDKKLREQMQIELRLLQQRIGITFVFVTHDQEEALTLSDRIAVMSSGEVLEIESPTRLYESPRTRFVADFIGSMNFFPGTVREVDDGWAKVECASLGEVRADTGGLEAAGGTPVVIGIRPEKFRLEFSRPQTTDHQVEGRLGPSAYLGERSHCYVFLPEREEPVAVALQNQDRVVSRLTGTHQAVWLTWASNAAVLLLSR